MIRHIGTSSMCPKLMALALAMACTGFAIDKNIHESCFLAIGFANGNTASIQLSNDERKEQSVSIERYSANGSLLDNIKKNVPAGGKTEVRLDLSTSTPEFGWIRVLSKGGGVSVSTDLEMLNDETLITLPQHAVHRHPETTKRLAAVPYKWTLDVQTGLGFLFYFVNLSEYPVQVGMCQDDYKDCSNPTLPHTVAPMASISFPIDQSRRYAVIESTPGYSVATSLRLAAGSKRIFDASSCIKFDGSTACASQPLPAPRPAPKIISPLVQQVQANIEDSKSSPAAVAVRKSGTAPSPQENAEIIRSGKGSFCLIITEPAKAEVYVDGLKLGVTPVGFVLLKRGDTPRTVEIRMGGYKTIEKHLVPDGELISIGVTLEKQ